MKLDPRAEDEAFASAMYGFEDLERGLLDLFNRDQPLVRPGSLVHAVLLLGLVIVYAHVYDAIARGDR